MSKLLCKVADVFQLKGRLVLQADTLYDNFDQAYKSGACLQLRRPDTSVIETESWLEMFAPSNYGRSACFSVAASLTKEDVAIGTEVWLDLEKIENA